MSRVKKMAIGLAIVASTVVTTPSFGQNTQKLIKNTQTELLDTVPADIADFPVKWIEKHYSKEKALEFFYQYTLEQVNAIRQHNGLPPLVLDSALSAVAQQYAEEMDMNQRYNHVGIDGSTPMKRANKVGYSSSLMLENIGYDFRSIAHMIQVWKESSVHFKNMTNLEIDKIGIGYYKGYWVNMFAKKIN